MATITNLHTGAYTTTWDGSVFRTNFSVTVPSGATHLVVRFVSTTNPTTLSFNGSNFTQDVSILDGNVERASIYSLASPSVGTFDVFFSTGGVARSGYISIDYLTDTSSVSSTNSAGGYAGNRSLTLTTVIGDIVLDVLRSSQTATVGAGQTAQVLNQTNMCASSEVATTTSTVMSWTHAATFSSIGAAVFVAAPTQSVTTTGPYKPADTITYSTSGLGTITSATLTDSAANVLTLTSITDTTAVIPAFTTSGQQANLFGTVTLTVGDGTDTATTTFTLDPPTGYTAVTASGLTVPSTDPLDWNYAPTGGWANEPADTDQLFHNDAFITYNANGTTTYTPGDLGTSYTAVYYLIDATDGLLTKVTKNYLNGVPASNTTQRGLSLSQSMRIGI